MQHAIATTFHHKELAFRAALRTVYFMGKKNLPTDIFSDLKQFQAAQVSVKANLLAFSACVGCYRFFTGMLRHTVTNVSELTWQAAIHIRTSRQCSGISGLHVYTYVTFP